MFRSPWLPRWHALAECCGMALETAGGPAPHQPPAPARAGGFLLPPPPPPPLAPAPRRFPFASAPRTGTRLFRSHPEDARRAVPRHPLEHATGGLRRLPPETIWETTEITKVTDPAVTQRTSPGASAWHTPSETQNKHRAQTRKSPRLLSQEGEQH